MIQILHHIANWKITEKCDVHSQQHKQVVTDWRT